MAGRYDLRSKQDDGDAYASLPGTSSAGQFVPHHMTDLKSKVVAGRGFSGCHPSRWLYELLNNCFTHCDLFDRARHAHLDTPFDWQHQHRLVLNGNQSHTSTSCKVLSSLCLDCHFHFVFKIEWDQQFEIDCCHINQATWPMRDTLFPWHNLVWVDSEPEPMIAQYRSKYHPLLAREYFACSASPCTLQITLDVLEPRMGSWWVGLLQDKDAILSELRRARELEPHRYEGATEAWATQAPLNLNTYLKNLIESEPGQVRNISKRNKRFAVLFGPRCERIFQELEFDNEPMMNDGIDEGLFIPKAPEPLSTPTSTTEPGTYRAYIEDVRAEVQCLIHRSGQDADESPSYMTQVLHQDLGCKEVPNLTSNTHLVNIERYKLLGVLPNQPREIIVNAYFRQWDLLPNKRRELIESLMGVANDCSDEQLSDFAMMQSSVFEAQLERHHTGEDDGGVANQALIYLGLPPPNTYAADSIISAFRLKLVQQPGDANTARNMLMMIAQASSSTEYQSELLTEASGPTFGTSKAILGLTGTEGAWEQCLHSGRKKLEASKSKDETVLYLGALDCIADYQDNAPLKAATSELREKYSAQVFAENDESTKLGNMSLPVGLNNIGNTCYLNSLLQYLYTVKAVRDIVLNYDHYKLELRNAIIQERRLGGNKMQMDRGEAVVAQAFVRELADLFDKLHKSDRVATRPSQRLANAVLLSTHSIIEDAKKAAAAATAQSSPPPLPARPSPTLPLAYGEDTNMVDGHVMEISETSSTGSSLTLVELPESAESAGLEESSESKTQLLFDERSTNITTPSVNSESPMTNATSPAGIPPESKTSHGDSNDDPMLVDGLDESLDIDKKVLSALEHQTRSSGTDQQDVEEVIGSIINRLQAAIQPSLVDEPTGIQSEKIMETFFVTTVNYTKKFDEPNYQSEVGFDRSITAFPAPDGPCSLYDALGRNFDQQVLEESRLSRYTAIKSPPPILHVLIQRSQSTGRKNNNAVVIPETLYLDRYMDAPHDSPDFKRRIQQWAVGNRLMDLRQDQTKLGPPASLSLQAMLSQVVSEQQDMGSFDPSFDVDGPIEVDAPDMARCTINDGPRKTSVTVGTNPLDSKPQLETVVRELMQDELTYREQQLEAELNGLRDHPYRLHAVICHRGHLSSGHYWVWIHDFEDNVWRWYNDADVRENPNTEEVLRELSNSGEPYYLCYVRDSDKEEHVNVPKRQPAAFDLIPTDDDGDIVIREKPLDNGHEQDVPEMVFDQDLRPLI